MTAYEPEVKGHPETLSAELTLLMLDKRTTNQLHVSSAHKIIFFSLAKTKMHLKTGLRQVKV